VSPEVEHTAWDARASVVDRRMCDLLKYCDSTEYVLPP
jgi:hypothetical protein